MNLPQFMCLYMCRYVCLHEFACFATVIEITCLKMPIRRTAKVDQTLYIKIFICKWQKKKKNTF